MTRLNFFRSLPTYSPDDRFRAFMSYRIAPVVDGAKPAELIMLCPGMFDTHAAWRRCGPALIEGTGLKHCILREREDCACALVYKTDTLSRYLDSDWNTPLIRNAGYRSFSTNDYLAHLKSRFRERCPHEIGLFLGIPYDDVMGFIKNDGKNYILNGYWKVYTKPERAKAIFKKYDSAKERVIERYQPV